MADESRRAIRFDPAWIPFTESLLDHTCFWSRKATWQFFVCLFFVFLPSLLSFSESVIESVSELGILITDKPAYRPSRSVNQSLVAIQAKTKLNTSLLKSSCRCCCFSKHVRFVCYMCFNEGQVVSSEQNTQGSNESVTRRGPTSVKVVVSVI